ncbi:nucleolar protein Nop5 [Annulohypoxylon maeteangense]|uniref:nucleolar protein Nop5 n=1 Tax=Annulohypoxylon maeteangense TaxID=1927788 RepID=UPI002007F8C2|nr:nucleolar protein Nop5 [Annulohypoxylon maeteangense]KAI0884590.1 nucleolar protein Nop5 [Annulohypoxylon maeteangense]
MPLFVLAETPAGYGLFKAKDKKLLSRDDVSKQLSSAEAINSMLSLKKMVKFEDSAQALGEYTALTEGKVTPMLQNLLNDIKEERKASLAVADPKLGAAINVLPELSITPVSDSTTNDLFRAVKTYLPELFPELDNDYLGNMALALSHSISRHKLKFSPDKVDVMIVQAIKLLDDLDKELNNYAMRVKEWYGWHFPELDRIVQDNLAYARIIMCMGTRENASSTDFSEILPEDIEARVKAAAEVSMGTEILEFDLENIKLLAEQVISFTEYRQQLSQYLTSRMKAIAPNLTELLGELVGARLIAHAGSLMKLAKSPGSTIQILGAEKALFRALKTKHDTPKYGLIYHSSLVGQATGKNKGKIARTLSAKAALCLRVDALSELSTEGADGEDIPMDDEERADMGIRLRAVLEDKLRRMEGKPLLSKGTKIGPNGATPSKFEVKPTRNYNADADAVSASAKKTPSKPLIQEVEDTPMGGADSESEEEDSDVEMDEAEDANKLVAKPKEKTPKKKESKKSKKATNGESTPKTPAKLSDADYSRLAEEAGISVTKFKRKYERGDVKMASDGTPQVVSKKELKKQKKAEAKAAEAEVEVEAEKPSKKRKHADEGEKKNKKKSKKEKSA